MKDAGFLLLCGGRSSRMGRCKALLEIEGGRLYESVARAGRSFDERLFSVNDPAIPTPEGFIRVPDIIPNCGPMGGLHAALQKCRSNWLVVAPCDAPYYTEGLALFLASRFDEDMDALILTDQSGRDHPLMGVYSKGCLKAIERRMGAGEYKLKRMLEDVRAARATPPSSLGDEIFVNLNTPGDLKALGGGERT